MVQNQARNRTKIFLGNIQGDAWKLRGSDEGIRQRVSLVIQIQSEYKMDEYDNPFPRTVHECIHTRNILEFWNHP